MLRKILPFALAPLLLTAEIGCNKKKEATPKAGEITEAQKAELRKKALENYKKIVEKYPDSPFAAQAQERIRALSPPKK